MLTAVRQDLAEIQAAEAAEAKAEAERFATITLIASPLPSDEQIGSQGEGARRGEGVEGGH